MEKRMLTAGKALAEIKNSDPETSLTITAIRKIINSGEINYVQMGKKKLINYYDLINYFTI